MALPSMADVPRPSGFIRPFLAAIVFLLASCAQKPLRSVEPDISGLNRPEIGRLELANPYAKTLRMSGKVEVHTSKRMMHARTSILVDRPDNMKMAFYDPLGTTIFFAMVNERIVFYAAPGDNVRENLARKKGATIRIGSLEVVPEDVIQNIQPGFSRSLLRGASLHFGKSRIRAEWDAVSVDWETDSSDRIIRTIVSRKGNVPLRFIYSYDDKGEVSVQLNSEIRFSFTAVETLEGIAADMFDPPSFGR